MSNRRRQSTLHLQMGQEIIYLLLAVSIVAALVLAVYAFHLLQERIKMESALLALTPPASGQQEPPPETKPPIITLTEAKGYYFELGSAALTDSFRKKLKDEVAPQLVQFRKDYNVEIIEIIGHTDEVPVALRAPNLDKALLAYLNGDASKELVAGDNVGLGMARAAAVAHQLRSDKRLGRFRILPLSAGQVIDIDQTLAAGGEAAANRERRRLEIRMRRPD